MNKKKIVIMDFDDTLINRPLNAYNVFKKMIDENVEEEDPIVKQSMLLDCCIWDQRGLVTRRYIAQRFLEKYNKPLCKTDIIEWWCANMHVGIELYPDAIEVLDYLRSKYRLGLLTNGVTDCQRRKIETVGLTDYFETIVVSGEYDVRKPDPRLFEIILEKMDCQKDEVVYVGDTYSVDVLGAHRTGIDCIWLNNYTNLYQPIDGLKMIHALSELKDLL